MLHCKITLLGFWIVWYKRIISIERLIMIYGVAQINEGLLPLFFIPRRESTMTRSASAVKTPRQRGMPSNTE
jgi:hypothetical protein